MYVGERKVPVSPPRVRTTDGDAVPLTTYPVFQAPTLASQTVLERIAVWVGRLDDRTWGVLMIDGIRVGGHVAVVALGIDAGGGNQILGLAEGATENSAVVTRRLTEWVDRGWAIPDGALAVIDGAQALAKALHDVFGAALTIQRCMLHTQRNVLNPIADSGQARIRQRLRKAAQEPTAEAAIKALKTLAVS